MADKLDITDTLIERAAVGDMTAREYQVLALRFMQRNFVINTITHEYLREVRSLERFKLVLFIVLLGYIVARGAGFL